MQLHFQGAGEIRLAAHAEGDPEAPAVLLLHGGGQTRHSWAGTAVRLAEAGFYAVAVDQRGHGDSAWAGAAGYSIDGFAADVRQIVRQLGSAPALVGASLGGLAKNLRRQADGRYRWHWDPDFMSGRLGLDASAPDRFEAAARRIDVPTLLVRGGISDVVSEDGVRAFLEVMPSAESVEVEHAAHMVAGDQNDPFSEAVIEFLTRRRGATR